MDLDVMTEPASWGAVQQLARDVESAHFAGLVLTEMRQPPWLSVVAAHQAAPTLQLSTGIAVAFPRSPMVMAQTAWELAEATGGRFRLGIGSQVRASIERRYGSEFAPPVARLRDYVEAVRACWAAFRGEQPLAHDGPYYQLNLLPPVARPRRHDHEDLRIDIAAVNHAMVRAAGEVADGIHVHPAPLGALPAPPPRARARGGGRAGGSIRRRRRLADPGRSSHRATRRRSGRRWSSSPEGRSRSTGPLATTRSSSTTSVSRHVGPPQRAVQGRRPRRDVGRDHRRDARALRHRLPVGRSREPLAGPLRRHRNPAHRLHRRRVHPPRPLIAPPLVRGRPGR